MLDNERERLPGYVPDLDKKLDYLIRERGGHGLDDQGRRMKTRISTQQDLADTLTVNNGNVTRWRADSRIPHLSQHIARIAAAFDCDGQSFRLDDIQAFKAQCELNRPSWGRLLYSALAKVDFKAVRPLRKSQRLDSRSADLEAYLDDEQMPILAPGEAFEVEFLDNGGNTSRSAWANWHVLIFSGDCNGFLTWMPRHREMPEFKGADRFPVQLKSLVVPKRAGQALRVSQTAFGEHEIVLVVSKDPVPSEMEATFCTSVKNKGLEPRLDELATWLEGRLRAAPAEAAIVRAPFFVGPVSMG